MSGESLTYPSRTRTLPDGYAGASAFAGRKVSPLGAAALGAVGASVWCPRGARSCGRVSERRASCRGSRRVSHGRRRIGTQRPVRPRLVPLDASRHGVSTAAVSPPPRRHLVRRHWPHVDGGRHVARFAQHGNDRIDLALGATLVAAAGRLFDRGGARGDRSDLAGLLHSGHDGEPCCVSGGAGAGGGHAQRSGVFAAVGAGRRCGARSVHSVPARVFGVGRRRGGAVSISGGWRAPIVASGSLRVAIAAVLAPWAIRNQRVFGKPIITTTHGGATLLLANNPSFYEYLRSAPWGATWNGQQINDEYENVQRLQSSLVQGRNMTKLVMGFSIDEVAVDREMYARAFKNIRAQPGMFLYACLVRMGRLWAVMPHQLTPNESPSRRGTALRGGHLVCGRVRAGDRRRVVPRPKTARASLGLGPAFAGQFHCRACVLLDRHADGAPLSSVVALAAAAGLARMLAKADDAKPLTEAA